MLRCVGVGKCHSPQNDGRVMCPSYRATREEEHATRGRSRLLFEMLDGHDDSAITDGWRSKDVLRGARPVPGLQGLQERLPDARRHGDVQGGVPGTPLREAGCARSPHYSMGWLPVWARLAAIAPGVVNRLRTRPGSTR